MKKPNKRSNFFVCSIVRINLFNSIKNPLQLFLQNTASINYLFHWCEGSLGVRGGNHGGAIIKSVDEKRGIFGECIAKILMKKEV